MRKPRTGEDVIVKWLDSGLTQTGDPLDPRVGVLAICETHGKVISCEESSLRLRRGMDSTIIKLATNHSGPLDKQVDVFAIWWSSVVSVRRWKE